jgi:hypothetical protein
MRLTEGQRARVEAVEKYLPPWGDDHWTTEGLLTAADEPLRVVQTMFRNEAEKHRNYINSSLCPPTSEKTISVADFYKALEAQAYWFVSELEALVMPEAK